MVEDVVVVTPVVEVKLTPENSLMTNVRDITADNFIVNKTNIL